MLGARSISDWLALVRISASSSTISDIQVYAPTSAEPNEETEDFYGALEEIYASLPRGDIKMMLGDFNSKVKKTESNDGYHRLVSSHELGTRNKYEKCYSSFVQNSD